MSSRDEDMPWWAWVVLALMLVGMLTCNVRLAGECEKRGLVPLYREYACVAGVRP